ncbi:hypothetical protein EXIGLDRAFT_759425 [Exidia glandulosa HHB12029]|uniref:F-box domain-containing protein n=1 Tax=Exidia glandulosa HHB12029 TaxID=1314781 RepID=A0A165Q5S9_EXIGL|nr:hypothetical protein EXIGLDRAFT_759425 [Exidia glandulosa HHB12029]
MSLATRLPPELWCAIWELLPYEDCVSLSHVCRYWRDIAIHCPRLWTHLEFCSFVHGETCECVLCGTQEFDDSGDPLGPFVRTATTPPGSTNMRLILALAARSGALPLHLSVHTEPVRTDLTLLEDFGARLVTTGASDRLVLLHVAFEDLSTLRCLLGGLKRLPALTTLVTEQLYDDDDDIIIDAQSWYDSDEIDMPLLESLILIGVGWPVQDRGSTVAFPSLRSLACSFWDAEDVEVALNVCPALDELHVLDPFLPQRPIEYTWRLEGNTLSKLERIPFVRVSGIAYRSEEWAIDNFSGPSRPEFYLRYRGYDAPSDYALDIWLDLQDVELVGLTWTHPTEDYVALTVESSNGVRRTLIQ